MRTRVCINCLFLSDEIHSHKIDMNNSESSTTEMISVNSRNADENNEPKTFHESESFKNPPIFHRRKTTPKICKSRSDLTDPFLSWNGMESALSAGRGRETRPSLGQGQGHRPSIRDFPGAQHPTGHGHRTDHVHENASIRRKYVVPVTRNWQVWLRHAGRGKATNKFD